MKMISKNSSSSSRRPGAASEPGVAVFPLFELVLAGLLVLVIVQPFLPQAEFFQPPAKVWSAPSIKEFDANDAVAKSYLSLPLPAGHSVLETNHLSLGWLVFVGLLILVGLHIAARDLRFLLRIVANAVCIRRIGRLRVYVSDQIQVPFSFWRPGRACVVIPEALLTRPKDFIMALAHEVQHHRQGDTRWVYALLGLKLTCLINPVVHLWSHWISELQEFACDETLVDQSKVESQAYARCLVEVAQSAIAQKRRPVCATGLTFLNERNLLKRRVEKMFERTTQKVGRSISFWTVLLITSMMGAASYASKGMIQDRRVTMEEAKRMAARARVGSEFPIVVNDLVLKQLNRYIGTPEGRQFMKKALARMQNYRSLVAETLVRYEVPLELMAVPIVESGYQILTEEESGTPARAAGAWQFIPTTARIFGLRVDDRVDDRVDERLDMPLSSDAAARYLKVNQLRFKDWLLSALSYNMGERNVQKAIEKLGTKDVWTLIRNGYEGDSDYVSRLMAAIIIMKNPESVN